MSLLDDLAKGQIDEDHNCRVPTEFGIMQRKNERYLFTTKQAGTTWDCICGRVFVSTGNPHNSTRTWEVKK